MHQASHPHEPKLSFTGTPQHAQYIDTTRSARSASWLTLPKAHTPNRRNHMLTALWSFRGFIWGSVHREFQLRYRRSLLGAAWAVINPLAQIAVYTLIFSQVMQARIPGTDSTFGYSIYLCAGLLTWGYFAEIMTRGQNMFIEHASLLKKVSFPRLCLPTINLATATINFAIIFTVFSAFLALSGTFPGWPYLAVLPVIVITAALATGLGIVLGVLNVFFRDVGQAFGILVQFWFWLTPIVYTIHLLPAKAHAFMELNPLFPIMTAMQGILASGIWPNWASLWFPVMLAATSCTGGFWLYRKLSPDMVDEL